MGYSPWGCRVGHDSGTLHFTIARTWKQPGYPLADKWIKKLWYIVRTAIKMKIFESVLMRWMNLGPIIQSEVSQKNKYCILTHIYGIQKDSTNKPICRAAVETQTEQTCGHSGGRRGCDELSIAWKPLCYHT